MAELPSTEKVIDTYRKVTIYYAGLEAAAAKFQKDKHLAAMGAIGATVRFLLNLKMPRELLTPLMEAGQIIEREMKLRTAKRQQIERDIYDSAVISLLNDEGVLIVDAAKKIHEHDPVEAGRLENFRKKMRQGRTPEMGEARDLYHLMKKELRERFPTNTAASALRASKAMKGKKG